MSQSQQEMIPKILLVEDDPSLREALEDTLTLANYSSVLAPDAEAALKILEQRSDIVMIVSDVNMGKLSGHDLLQRVKSEYPQIPVLLITAFASIRDSVDAMRNGAIDYLVKPFEPQALVDIVDQYMVGRCQPVVDEPVAKAPSSQELLHLARRMAQTDSTVLIVGESGTGKEVLARYIHEHSPRAKHSFIAINCAAIPENMLEAMLFGYEKGAYTGAYASAPGKFEQANGGTILLDEISEMDLGLQAKLLRVLQEREVERLGGRKTISLDVRVLATSNRNMKEEVAAGKFREDLFYRLSVLPLHWQPLRHRREDILPLAERLLHKHANKLKRHGVRLDESAQQSLFHYSWPGNVRELDNVMQRALILQSQALIRAEDLGLDLITQTPLDDKYKAETSLGHSALHSASEIINGTEVASDQSTYLGDDLKQREFEIILDTLKEEKGSRKNTAKRLGISPRTLRYKLAKMREIGINSDEQMGFA